VREIKKFLGNTDMTLKEIARLTGFDNEFYLSNVFRRVVGVSPKEYRERFADI
jgi:AraC-like DNA-binding protein